MFKGIYRNHRRLSKLLILIGLLLTGFGLSTVLAFVGVQLFFGLDVLGNPQLLSEFYNAGIVNALKFVQMMNSLGIFVFPPIMFAYMVTGNPAHYLDFDKRPAPIYLILTILIMFSALPLINALVSWNEGLSLPEFFAGIEQWMREKEDSAALITKAFLEMDGSGDYLVNLLIIGVIPAIGEELLFRGLIQKRLSNYLGNVHAAIWISAFIFSAMHLQFYGFVPRLLLGALFGYLFVWSGSLWIPILAHLINNAGAVTVQYVYGADFTKQHVDSFGTQEGDFVYLLMSAIVLCGLMYFMSKEREV